MADIKEGQTATNPKTGERVVFRGGNWHRMTSGAPGSPVARPIDPQARKVLNDLNAQANEAREIQRQYQDAGQAIRRLKPGPARARYLESAIPDENGGVLDTLGAIAIGGPSRLLGAISSQDISDFQRLRGLQSQRVLSEQIQQKGPQTESDAARMQMTEISPYKDTSTNMAIIRAGMAKTQRVQQRANFYTQWANRFGLNGTNPQGETVEQAFQRSIGAQASPAAKASSGVTIRRIK